ncbi:MAG: DUF2442 domain-containing protein [Longimicrobiales bacterium]
MHPRVTSVRALIPFEVELWFTDGSGGTVDLAPWIRGARGVFSALQDPAFFAQVAVDREAGTIVWPNGADLDPDVLFEAAHNTDSATRRSQ